ncbi:MAG TPA: exodeoxyribonuclease VII large subunit [Bacteroidetes bacterium]|nr:exodeoxyribonuclease VII large subunit [Bacteroidota bacterium]
MGLPLENAPQKRIYSISEITREIKQILESAFPPIWLEGEISNFKRHSSGHLYFVLKDEKAQIPAVMWRSYNSRLFFTPRDGIKVLANGNITVYERRGTYQFEVVQLQPAGIGELQLAFEQLKQKLREEGLFAPERKKPVPPYPERIGIVTSPTGAALQDMLSVFGRRFPGIQLILAPVRVQGEGAAEEIARAITDFNEYGEVDLLIIGRGGGSLEDLWPFNEEMVARAIFASEIPVISAVGHEVDFSISDFVADLRAPTPSAAAELAVKNKTELREYFRSSIAGMYRDIREQISYYIEKVDHLQNSYALKRPSDVIRQYQQRLDELTKSMELQYQYLMDSRKQQINSLHKQLISLSPQSILNRGYSLCFREEDGKLVKTSADVQVADKIRVQFHRGQIKGKVDEILPGD